MDDFVIYFRIIGLSYNSYLIQLIRKSNFLFNNLN